MEETQSHFLIIDSSRLEVKTKGNFSTITIPAFSALIDDLQELFYQFEKQLELRVVCWEIRDLGRLYGTKILINHAPIKKSQVAPPPKPAKPEPDDPDEPDVRLY